MVKYLAIIIDGYNFLKTTGLLDVQVSDMELEKGRRRLIQLLAKSFPDPVERKRLTVVFDSSTLLNLPVSLTVQGIDVRFSKGYESADELIMEMIRSNSVPKRLLVVSSDHEIQTCAQRRRASFVDSDVWLDELESKIELQRTRASGSEESGSNQTDMEDAAYWLTVFSDPSLPDLASTESFWTPANEDRNSEVSGTTGDELERDQTPTDSEDPAADKPGADKPNSQSGSARDQESGWDDIFPPGYGEDLLE